MAYGNRLPVFRPRKGSSRDNRNHPTNEKGENMPTIQDLRLQRGQLGTEAHRLLTAAGCTAEQRRKAEALLNDADAVTDQITLLERSARLEEHNRTMPAPAPRPNPGAANNGDPAAAADERERNYRNAFEVYMRLGERGLRENERAILNSGRRDAVVKSIMIAGEQRDLTTTATGNYIIPQEFYNELIAGKKFIGALLDSCHKKTTPGNGAPMKIGYENDTANTITVVAENTTVTEADPVLSGIIQSTDTLATLIKVSKQELADAGFDLPALFRDRLGKRYKRGLEHFIGNGDGSNIAGLITGITVFTTTAAPAGPGYPDFVACQDQLDPIYEPTAAWYMHKKTRTYVMGLLDTLNRPLFLPNPQTGMLDQILGFAVKLTAELPSATTAGAFGVVFGDMDEGYLLRDDGEMTIQRLDERYADQLMVGFLGYTRAGGNVTDPGSHPLVGMKTHV
jgi:HK97 family phage major capsid protein